MFNKERDIMSKISILIPTRFDSRYIIELALRSIWKNTDYPSYQIIVCNSGVDEVTEKYLISLAEGREIKLIKATDCRCPKNDLVKAVETEYYVLMHDDVQILKSDWLTRRMQVMGQDRRNAIVGMAVRNYGQLFVRRFFPLCLLVKTEVSRKLDLKWGKLPERKLDNGAIAYERFFCQREYKFVPFDYKYDIRHFGNLTWPVRKYHLKEKFSDLEGKLRERERKIAEIKEILEKKLY